MRRRTSAFGFVVVTMLLASGGIGHAADVTYAFTGTGTHGSVAWGRFTTAVVSEPDYYAPGGVYSSFSLTVSNIPGNGPGVCIFLKTDLDLFSAFTISGGVPSILPLGGHGLGPPDENHYDLSGGVEPNQSTLTYNRFYRDDITWSALTPVSPPPPPSLSVQAGSADITLLWPTTAVDFGLEETASLSPPNWTAVTNVPVAVGENFSVTLPNAGAHFFRLKWPAQ
jgi:hypothetical protein